MSLITPSVLLSTSITTLTTTGSSFTITSVPHVTTTVVPHLTTVCGGVSTITQNGKFYDCTDSKTITILDCPCTITKELQPTVAPAVPVDVRTVTYVPVPAPAHGPTVTIHVAPGPALTAECTDSTPSPTPVIVVPIPAATYVPCHSCVVVPGANTTTPVLFTGAAGGIVKVGTGLGLMLVATLFAGFF